MFSIFLMQIYVISWYFATQSSGIFKILLIFLLLPIYIEFVFSAE